MELRVIELVLEAERAADAARHRHDPPTYVVIPRETRPARWHGFGSGVAALVALVVSAGSR